MTDIGMAQSDFVADWSGIDELPAPAINQFLMQLGLPTAIGTPEGVYLSFGQGQPPVIFGDDALTSEQIAAYGGRLRIQPHGRIFLTRERLGELVGLLTQACETYDSANAVAQQQAGQNA